MSYKVLIADDDELVSALLEAKMQARGFDVLRAEDGEQALNMAETHKPDVILLDVMMPGLDGLEVLRQLQHNPGTREIPIIMLTARKSENDVVAGLNLGARDYIVKPFMPKELFVRIQRVLPEARA